MIQIKHFLTVAFRNLKRNKSYTFVNVLGLTLGITCALVLALMVRFAESYDTYHTHYASIYRITTHDVNNGDEFLMGAVPATLAEVFPEEFPGIKKAVMISGDQSGLVTIPDGNNEHYFEENNGGLGFTEPSFFEIFDRKIIQGNKAELLTRPNQVVLSQKYAEKYFKGENPLHKTLLFRNNTYTVVGVMEDYPANTDFPFNIFFSYSTISKGKIAKGWANLNSGDEYFVLIPSKAALTQVKNGLQGFSDKYIEKRQGSTRTFHIQPLSAVHFDKRYDNFSGRTISQKEILILGLIALFLIITACINFINLSTAVAAKRGKEVGVRKVLGGERKQLILQFMAETGLITAIALVLSLMIIPVVMEHLNQYMQWNIPYNPLSDWTVWVMALGLWVLVTVLSGFYPAFILSGFNPVAALKSRFSSKKSTSFALRRGLVILQFLISQVFIICTFVLLQQLHYLQSTDMGFNKEAVVSVPIPENDYQKSLTFRNEVARESGVQNLSLCYSSPASDVITATGFQMEGSEETYFVERKVADTSYFSTYGLQLLAGRKYTPSDSLTQIVVNEAFCRKVGMAPQEILGHTIKLYGGRIIPVVGVVKDFHTLSMKNELNPVMLYDDHQHIRQLGIKVFPGQVIQTMDHIQKRYKKLYPQYNFHYQFMDEQVASFYDGERRMASVISLFAGIAIFIGCLGLYGLISFMANQKVKEIGVRKVLGANLSQIMWLFIKEFLLLIGISFVLAAPLGAYLMNNWLQNFSYHIALGAPVFIAAIAFTIIIAGLTIGFRSYKAALTDPAKAVKIE